jgi:hypothetical protein
MRHINVAAGAALVFLALGTALSACSATAPEDAIPYGFSGFGPGYYSDSADIGQVPTQGGFGPDGD